MSEYYDTLSEESKVRYAEKLKLAGLSLEEDPYDYRNNNNYKDDMTAWPPLEYGHIFTYFIRRPGLYTQEQLLSWKQLEAYNYFLNGYVRSVHVYKLKSGACVLKSCVNPSQRSADKPHNPWVIVNADGSVVTAHCTCMAGLGEGCSHVAAVMFKVEYAVRQGFTSVTSSICGWNSSFSTKTQPDEIVNICFSRPKKQHLDCDEISEQEECLKTDSIENQENTASASHTADKYCHCKGPEEGKMVACDNSNCESEWFHFQCVGLTRKPRGLWYCSEACKLKANNI